MPPAGPLPQPTDGACAPESPQPRTRGELEADLAQAVILAHKQVFGRGPYQALGHLVGRIAVVHARQVLTPMEVHLAGRDLAEVRRFRRQILDRQFEILRTAVEALLNVRIRSVLADVDPASDEMAFVFGLCEAPRYVEI